MKENPADKIYDFMWDFVKTGKQKSNPQSLKEYVYDLIQLTIQKTAGQRKNKPSDISYENLEMIKWSIIIEATCLVLSGDVDKLIKEGDIE